MKQKDMEKLSHMGAVEKLSVLPLIDYYAVDDRFKTEAGVAYWIAADDTTILMDVGFNKKKEHPSPLLHNMKLLDLTPEGIDLLFFSHVHLDHVGGMAEQKKGVFSLSQGPSSLREIPAYAPTSLAPSKWNPGPEVEIVDFPKVLATGIASIGPLSRKLFLMGPTLEHSLAIKVRNKGIVLIIGCGHQTIERILEQARMLFDEPIYAIIGGLHFPVQGGRIKIGPLNLQNIVGTDKKPWQGGITKTDVYRAIEAIKAAAPQIVALSPHDSSDWSIDQFKSAFAEKYQEIKVGQHIKLSKGENHE